MSVPEILHELVGKWRGINRLHTVWIPENPVRETPSTATVELTARGRFLKFEYDWAFEDSAQEGLILIGCEDAEYKAFWIDSWHMGNKFMVSEGIADGGAISLKGFYAVPNHPDWGWRTVFKQREQNSFQVTMFNVSPDGDETPAVEMEFERQ
jgi:Protein of unknown function (DUF1579)